MTSVPRASLVTTIRSRVVNDSTQRAGGVPTFLEADRLPEHRVLARRDVRFTRRTKIEHDSAVGAGSGIGQILFEESTDVLSE